MYPHASMMLAHGELPETTALVARMTTPPTSTRRAIINTTIALLKGCGAWDELPAIWVLAAADSQAARLNWKGATHDLTLSGAPTFTVDRGYVSTYGIGGGALATGYLPTDFAQNDASISVWYQTVGANVGVDKEDGGGITGGGFLITGRSVSGINGAVQDDAVALSASDGTAGLVTATRESATQCRLYKNGAEVSSNAAAGSVAPGTGPMHLCGYHNAANLHTHDNRIAAAAFGGHLSASQAAGLYTALQQYMTAVGA